MILDQLVQFQVVGFHLFYCLFCADRMPGHRNFQLGRICDHIGIDLSHPLSRCFTLGPIVHRVLEGKQALSHRVRIGHIAIIDEMEVFKTPGEQVPADLTA